MTLDEVNKLMTGSPSNVDIRDKHGRPVAADDPSRQIWYGLCSYWTDNSIKEQCHGDKSIAKLWEEFQKQNRSS